MTLTIVVLLVLALFVAQIFFQETSRYHFNLWMIMGTRDVRPEPSLLAARLDRAKNNMLEALPLFLGLAMLALIKEGDTGPAVHGATVFLIARTLYIPIYAAGIPVVRSLVWLAGMGGMLWMALTLMG